MTTPDLARQTAGLLDLAGKSRARILNELVGLAAGHVPACAGASAAIWQDGEPLAVAASHPDVADLIDVEVASGQGPTVAALTDGTNTECADTLRAGPWPAFRESALRQGVRCCVTFAHGSPAAAVTLSLYATRPGVLEPGQVPLAELLVAVGSALIGNAASYGDAWRMALQFRDAAESRALVDQAKGMLMHAFGCTADEAFARMRALSQKHEVKVTEIARRVVDSRLATAG